MSKLECKRAMRTLELDAYAHLVSAFRAQGDLTERKLSILQELQCIFRISIDRHKAELRRAANDERLCTIARRLSCGGSVSAEWTRQAKRVVPLLPTLDYANSEPTGQNFFRVLADHVLVKTLPVLHSYPDASEPTSVDSVEENVTSKKKKKELNTDQKELDDESIRPLDNDSQNLVYLKNGVAVDSRHVRGKIYLNTTKLVLSYNSCNINLVESIQPSEYMERLETSLSESKDANSGTGNYNPSTFIRLLVEKYKKHQQEKENESFKRYNHLNHHHQHVNNHYQAQMIPQQVSSQITQSTSQQYSSSPLYYPNTTVYNGAGIMKPYYPATASAQTAPTVKSNYDLVSQNPKPTVNPTGTGKNSLKISQIIDTMSQQQQQHSSQLMASQYGKILPPPSASIISTTAQAIKLTPPAAVSPSTTTVASNGSPSNPPSTPTIVKLTPAPASLNTSTQSIQNGTSGAGGNIIKHLVLPKANQKLIIVPNSVTNGDPQASAPPSSSSSSPNLISKLVLLKSKSDHQTVVSSSNDDLTTTSATQLSKNFKILGSPSILNAASSSSSSSTNSSAGVSKSVLNINNKNIGGGATSIVSMKPIKIIEAMTSEISGETASAVNKRKADEDENGKTSDKSATNLICLKLENGSDNVIRNGLANHHQNGEQDCNAASTKRIKLVNLDLKEEQ